MKISRIKRRNQARRRKAERDHQARSQEQEIKAAELAVTDKLRQPLPRPISYLLALGLIHHGRTRPGSR